MQTGTFVFDGLTYVFGENGRLIGGWTTRNGKTYYLQYNGQL